MLHIFIAIRICSPKMTWLLAVILFCVLIVEGYVGDNLIQIQLNPRITPTYESIERKRGKIPGITSCGGPAKVLSWRYEACTGSLPEGNCKILSDGKANRCEITFIPSESTTGGLILRSRASAKDVPPRTYDVPIPNSSVKGGQVYTVRSSSSVVGGFKGKTMTFQHMIVRQADDFVEACIQADFDNI